MKINSKKKGTSKDDLLWNLVLGNKATHRPQEEPHENNVTSLGVTANRLCGVSGGPTPTLPLNPRPPERSASSSGFLLLKPIWRHFFPFARSPVVQRTPDTGPLSIPLCQTHRHMEGAWIGADGLELERAVTCSCPVRRGPSASTPSSRPCVLRLPSTRVPAAQARRLGSTLKRPIIPTSGYGEQTGCQESAASQHFHSAEPPSSPLGAGNSAPHRKAKGLGVSAHRSHHLLHHLFPISLPFKNFPRGVSAGWLCCETWQEVLFCFMTSLRCSSVCSTEGPGSVRFFWDLKEMQKRDREQRGEDGNEKRQERKIHT